DLVMFPEASAGNRQAIYLWEEASRPVFVLEVLSHTRHDQDPRKNPRLYQDDLRVPEYFVCDPMLDYPRAWGYRLVGGQYQQIEAGRDGRVWSEELRAWFGTDESGQVRVWDERGRRMLRHREAVERAETAERE